MSAGSKLSSIPEENGSDSDAALKKSSKLSPDQIAYRKEISKVWEAQRTTLSNPQHPIDFSGDGADISAYAPPLASEPPNNLDDETMSVVSTGSAGSSATPRSQSRILVIKRFFTDNATGATTEESETITDVRLVNAYLNQRRFWESKRKRKMIAAAASAARAKRAKPSKPSALSPEAPIKIKLSKPKKEVTIKCGTCGEVGHMKTNKICPMYNAANESKEPLSAPTKIVLNKSLLEPTVPVIRLKVSPPLASPSNSTDLTTKLLSVHDKLMSDPESWPFHHPVSRTDYPHYFQIIQQPLDFGTIRHRILADHYSTIFHFLVDIKLVRDNCIAFNGSDHPFSVTISRLYELSCALSNHHADHSSKNAEDTDESNIILS